MMMTGWLCLSLLLLVLVSEILLIHGATIRILQETKGDWKDSAKLIRFPSDASHQKTRLGSYIVLLHTISDYKEVIQDYALEPSRIYRHVFQGFAVDSVKDRVLEDLLQDARVDRIAQDGEIINREQQQVQEEQEQSPAPWHLDRLDGVMDSTYRYSPQYNGTGVHVYIVDSGIRATHSEFDNIPVDPDCFDEIGPCNTDTNGHGTHIAGIVGGKTYGIAKGVTLHDVRIRDHDNRLSFAYMFAGMDHVMEQKELYPNRKIILSLSFSSFSYDIFDQAAQQVLDAGIPVIAAAGNQGGNACDRSPARLAGVVTVGSTTMLDQRADATNVGPCLDIWALGRNILSAGFDNDFSVALKSGTSMATAMVSGALAVYWSAGKTWDDLLADSEYVDNLADESTTGNLVSLRQLVTDDFVPPSFSPSSAPTMLPSGMPTTMLLETRQLSILETIAQNFNLQQLEAYLGFSGLLGTLSGQGSYTVLTPWDNAFDKLNENWVARLQSRSWSIHLQNLLLYHIYSGSVVIADLNATQTLVMANGESIGLARIPGTSRLRVNGVLVLATYNARNGFAMMTEDILMPKWMNLNVFDVAEPLSSAFASLVVGTSLESVLRDPDATFTLFLPNDSAFDAIDHIVGTDSKEDEMDFLERIIAIHIIDGAFPSVGIRPGQSLPVYASSQTSIQILGTNPVLLGGNASQAAIIIPDLPANNGIVHVIYTVLLPM